MFSVKKISLGVGLVAVVVAAVFIGRQSGGESTNNTLLITPRAVERRDLSDVLTVSGEVRRDETKKINSAVDGKVSQINGCLRAIMSAGHVRCRACSVILTST
jgi:multidrug efflux pump subunit AcrA (membrane-fusion protein)